MTELLDTTGNLATRQESGGLSGVENIEIVDKNWLEAGKREIGGGLPDAWDRYRPTFLVYLRSVIMS